MSNRRRNWCARFAAREFTFPARLHRWAGAWLFAAIGCAGLALAQSAPTPAQFGTDPIPPPEWSTLRKDGVHDPKGPAVKEKLLQEPRDALSVLPPDTTGNMVRWVLAIESGAIQPRPSLKGAAPRIRDTDVLLDVNGSMPVVLFPHKRHTEWLDCANCHDGLFKQQAGGDQLSMFQILAGEQCGVCHGAVSFPLTECFRCHSVVRPGEVKGKMPDLPPSHALPRPQ